MSQPAPRLLTAHVDLENDRDGLDLLITLWPDGSAEIANRPGMDSRWVTWSAPVQLEEAS